MQTVKAGTTDVSDYVTSIKIKRQLADDQLIGNAVSAELTLEMDTTRMSSAVLDDVKKQKYHYDGTTFIIHERPKRWSGTITVTLYDKMLLFAKTLKISAPSSGSDVIDAFTSKTGVTINTDNISVPDTLATKYNKSHTMREWIAWLAEINGTNAFIVNDKVVFRQAMANTATLNYVYDYALSQKKTIRRVAYSTDEKLYDAGSGTSCIYLNTDNPLITSGIPQNILNIYNGKSFYIFDNLSGIAPSSDVYPGDLLNYGGEIMLATDITITPGSGEAEDAIEAAGDLPLDGEDEKISKKKAAEKKAKDIADKFDYDPDTGDLKYNGVGGTGTGSGGGGGSTSGDIDAQTVHHEDGSRKITIADGATDYAYGSDDLLKIAPDNIGGGNFVNASLSGGLAIKSAKKKDDTGDPQTMFSANPKTGEIYIQNLKPGLIDLSTAGVGAIRGHDEDEDGTILSPYSGSGSYGAICLGTLDTYSNDSREGKNVYGVTTDIIIDQGEDVIGGELLTRLIFVHGILASVVSYNTDKGKVYGGIYDKYSDEK